MAIRKSSTSGIPFGNDANRPANPQVGQPYFNGESSRLELYTSATGWQNIVQETPAVVSVVGQLNETTPSTLTINGTNFAAGATAFVVGTNGVETSATTTTLVSVVEISAVFPALSPTYEPYDVKVVNPSNLYGVLYEALGVNNSPIWSTAAGSLGTFTELQSVSVTVAATDATDSTNSPLSYSVVSGALPGGLTLNSSTGVISGTASNVIPNTTYSFTIAATDGRNTAVTRAFSITITDRPPVWSTGTTLPTFTRNVAYSTTVVATDDDAVSSYTLQSGSLPTGLSLNSSTGVISGTPSDGISTTFVIRVTDSGGNYTDRTFTIPNAGPVWSTGTTLPTFTKSSAYSTTVVATDDSGNNPTYSVASGSLPAGLTLSSAGVISGTPTSSTDASVTIRATDASGNTADRTFTMPNAAPTWTSSGTLSAVANSTIQLVAVDDGVKTFSIVSGTLPSGSTLNSSTGVISTGGTAGDSAMVFRVTDENGRYADVSLTISIALYTFTSHTFTNAGVTGQSGPTLAQARSAYSSTSWANTYLGMTTQGIQEWTVPKTGSYTITAAGAKGGIGASGYDSGYGATMTGTFSLTAGNVIKIAVGQQGSSGAGNNNGGGGGGGTFVATSANSPLICAGGGAGSSYSTSSGITTQNHGSSAIGNGNAGSLLGSDDNPGAGFSQDASNTGNSNPAAKAFINGAAGGSSNSATLGGFGGGGAGYQSFPSGGGGGGYQGGDSGRSEWTAAGNGQGGLSYNNGSSQSNSSGSNNGHGYVTITKL